MTRRLSVVLLIMVLALSFTAPSYGQTMSKKLARGLANVLTAPLEPIVQMMNETRDHGDMRGFFMGGSKGLVNMFGRIGTGIYEIVTFPIPVPKEYRPIFLPEFVIEGDLLLVEN